ncbi:MAG TPA: hypothetical protein ENI44_04005 [Thermoplasmatales archaeon]|nr:hypothetical protein [Thermoplasmatales archaeon]
MGFEPLYKQKQHLEEKKTSEDKLYNKGYKEGVEEAFKQFEETIQLYNRYKDNIKLLMEEQNNIWKKWIEYYEKQKSITKEDFLQRYNDWLFSYIFECKTWIRI